MPTPGALIIEHRQRYPSSPRIQRANRSSVAGSQDPSSRHLAATSYGDTTTRASAASPRMAPMAACADASAAVRSGSAHGNLLAAFGLPVATRVRCKRSVTLYTGQGVDFQIAKLVWLTGNLVHNVAARTSGWCFMGKSFASTMNALEKGLYSNRQLWTIALRFGRTKNSIRGI